MDMDRTRLLTHHRRDDDLHTLLAKLRLPTLRLTAVRMGGVRLLNLSGLGRTQDQERAPLNVQCRWVQHLPIASLCQTAQLVLQRITIKVL